MSAFVYSLRPETRPRPGLTSPVPGPEIPPAMDKSLAYSQISEHSLSRRSPSSRRHPLMQRSTCRCPLNWAAHCRSRMASKTEPLCSNRALSPSRPPGPPPIPRLIPRGPPKPLGIASPRDKTSAITNPNSIRVAVVLFILLQQTFSTVGKLVGEFKILWIYKSPTKCLDAGNQYF